MENTDLTTVENEFPEIKKLCESNKGNSGALLLVLQKIQATYGYIPKSSLSYIAKCLMVSSSHLYGIITFYDQFRLTPKKKYTIKICRGTGCELNGAPALADRLGEFFDISKEGEIDSSLFSLEYSACLGECGKAPLMIINDEVCTHATPEKLESVIREILEEENRGAVQEGTVA